MSRQLEEYNYWNTAAETSENLRDEFICDSRVTDESCLEVIAEAIEPVKDGSVFVEIGCGIGRLTKQIADCYTKAHFFAFDISEEMLKRAPDAENIKYAVSNGRTLNMPIAQVDVVYSMLVFQHIPEEGIVSYISEASRILKSGGVFFFQYIEGTEHEPFSHHYDELFIANTLRDNGFEIAHTEHNRVDDNWTWVKAVKL